MKVNYQKKINLTADELKIILSQQRTLIKKYQGVVVSKKMNRSLSSLKKTQRIAQSMLVARVYYRKSSKKGTQILVPFWKLELA